MDNRRLILLVTFCFSLVMLWDAWVKYNQPQPVPGAASSAVASQNAGVPSAPASAAASVAAAQGGQIGGHARFDVADIGFRDFRPHGHR
jgi:YidC/Oxa1 family membrane protein insertase